MHGLETPARAYELSFLPEGGRDGVPELVITVSKAVAESLDTAPEAAYTRDADERVSYHLPLQHKTAREVAGALHALLYDLNGLVLSPREPTNHAQLLTVKAMRLPQGGLHSHPVHGEVSVEGLRWLERVGKEGEGELSSFTYTRPLPAQVASSMQQAWKSLAWDRTSRAMSEDIHGRITEDGRFTLTCPGNACDVSIYPDGFYGSEDGLPAYFGCHNLDAPEQQLTLVVGLAVLHELMMEDLG